MTRLQVGLCGLAGAVMLMGCGTEGSVRVDSLVSKSTLAAGAPVDATLELPTNDGTMAITTVSISVTELEIEGDEEGDLEVESGGTTITLALDGSATELAFGAVPVGTYEQFGLEMRKDGAIRVTGSYEGAPFQYVSAHGPEIEYDLEPPVEVQEGQEATVELSFDVAAWFADGSGGMLNPADPANRAAIEQNIWASITANAAEVELADDD